MSNFSPKHAVQKLNETLLERFKYYGLLRENRHETNYNISYSFQIVSNKGFSPFPIKHDSSAIFGFAYYGIKQGMITLDGFDQNLVMIPLRNRLKSEFNNYLTIRIEENTEIGRCRIHLCPDTELEISNYKVFTDIIANQYALEIRKGIFKTNNSVTEPQPFVTLSN